MPSKKQIVDTANRVRRLREQRFVIDELEAQLVLGAPEDEARLKERVATERKALQDLEAKFRQQPKAKSIRSRSAPRRQ
jgi:hypothetical protein